ncbi:LuxR C-terminal-related transcriptional regulator [Arsenophonus nasoniae]|uniref:LuxR C-terminal-related transcriptional regulator n=1 Tax=Arsenophonus nasoniae TaxID=638 RepID=A0A4P7KY99_9GAMM|nr:LuxR family transcriptional regulator [Arsenophonus nasoniae]QBY45131.1 Transcriptional activator protein EsaR [Arsenophonus nasoniae]WGM05335.1 LuxR C-terminal-related transcriptional regulator [Arsenophonus nasoniae]WGM10341.1 LuxR C-terminal-related transcriptional regulator [Arsenophonus nasoniae]WGM15056.1 LuxR C-terminal-related transcriptional regulator [Arsenophonus nasoniae]
MTKGFFKNSLINEKIKNFLDEQIIKYGDIKYAYLVMNKINPMDVIIINNHTEWFELYIKGSYQLIDPVIINAMERVDDFHWDEKIMIYSEMKLPKIFKHSKKYNINKGHTFVLHDYLTNLAVLSIFETGSDDNNKYTINSNKEKFQQLLIKTHQKLLSLYDEIEKGRNQYKPSGLSSRENEILYWVSIGRTYQDIAKMLGIKQGTIKFHMGNVVKKLGVSSTKHAIKLATELKMIQLPS